FEMPDEFFRLSLKHDILTSVDLSCLRTCLQAASSLPATNLHVNLFPTTIMVTPPDRLLALFAEERGKRDFCLEISEQQFAGDLGSLREHVTAIKSEGIKVAI